MTYRLVFTYTASVNATGIDVPVAEQTWHADTLPGVAALARRWSAQFDLHDFVGADVYVSGEWSPLNPEPLVTADDVCTFVTEWTDGVAA